MITTSSVSRRNFVALSAAALGAAALAGTAAPRAARADAAEVVFANPGTYTASAPGRNGDVELTATVSETAIESIEVTATSETYAIGGQACSILIDQVVGSQTANPDLVSGATFTTGAFNRALAGIIEQAGGDASKLAPAPQVEEVAYVTDADVVVVGAGAAGLTAALTAAQEGARVVLLEKSAIVGGNTNAANSGINAAESQIQIEGGVEGATIADLTEKQMNNDLARPELVEAFVNATGEVADWIAAQGVEFELPENGGTQLSANTDTSRTGGSIVMALLAAIEADENVELYKRVAATDLVLDDEGRVSGVVATTPAGELTFSGKAVILTTGGYGQDHDMVLEYRPDLANTITDEIAPTTGDGFKMAVALGAVPTDMGEINFHGHCVPGYSMMFTRDVPGGRTAPAGICVNKEGLRFDNEANFPNNVYQPILDQTDGAVFHIFPEEFAGDVIQAMVNNGFAKKTETVEELAEALGVDAANLVAQVEKWNADIEAGGDTEFGREDENAVALTAPYYGYEFRDAVHYFMGGVLINTSAQVVDEADQPIPGLYAAGEVTGGMQGTTRVDGTGLMDGFTFGRIAAKAAVAEVLA